MLKHIGKMALLLVFALTATLVDAQITTGSMAGKVVDSSGEGLIGANVLATHTPSGTSYGSSTRDDGGFSLPNLRVGGPYSIEVSYIGYQTQMIFYSNV